MSVDSEHAGEEGPEMGAVPRTAQEGHVQEAGGDDREQASPSRPAKAWLKDNQYLIRAWFWILIAVPGILLWRESILFVIIISLATQIDTSLGAHEARKSRR